MYMSKQNSYTINMSSQPSHLDAEIDFFLSIGPRRTLGTLKGEAEKKIGFCAKNTSGAYSFALRQASEVGRL